MYLADTRSIYRISIKFKNFVGCFPKFVLNVLELMELKVVEQKIATKISLRKLEAKTFVHTQHLSDF
jgi:hypothetical protein